MASVFESQIGQDTAFGFLNRKLPTEGIYNPHLIVNSPEHQMLEAIKLELSRSDSFEFSVAFITSSALALLKQPLLDFKGHGVIYTSTYLDFNEPSVFEELLGLENVEVRVLNDSIDAFHSKGYIFHQEELTTAIIGSSNLTRNALIANDEWNIKFSALPDGDIALQLSNAINRLRKVSSLLTHEWIQHYENSRQPQVKPSVFDGSVEQVIPVGHIVPNAMQQEALQLIKEVQDQGEKRAVVISATGTGKTILAALAVRQTKPQKMLFIVHREQILDKAITEFQRVLNEPKGKFGKFVGSEQKLNAKYVFATIQTISRDQNLKSIDPDLFDFVIIDEVHRAGAATYNKVIDHLSPKFLFGLTATPERSDDFNIYELFDFNVPYEIRLQKALESNMLVPFSYYGVSDYTDEDGVTIDDTSKLNRLIAPERVKYIVEMLERYGHTRNTKGLFFCSNVKEAEALSALLNQTEVNGKRLRTKVLSGENSQQDRAQVVGELEKGLLDYILTVDIFNEGIDIPQLNQVVMLRNTQSSIIFTQQLGRGLRKAEGKDHLRVIDFIGNYKNNFLVPIALFGDRSLNKDSIRKQMRIANEKGSIAGISSISFDKVAEERIFKSLEQVKLSNIQRLKEAYRELESRIGRPVFRMDFARYDTADPVVIATSKDSGNKNYWHFLTRIKKAESELSDQENGYITFLDNELLNGKRPQELLLIKELLQRSTISLGDFKTVVEKYGAHLDDETLKSIERILSLEFHTQKEREKYLEQKIAARSENTFSIDPAFKTAYNANTYFKKHVDDVIETGLWINRHRYAGRDSLIYGERYSRKDACRLLNWANNQYSTIYGYKADNDTLTCPIFITYNKAEGISDSTKYEDGFDNESTVHWYTKNNRTLKSETEANIVGKKYELPIFVKKDDAEGTDFYYCGLGTSYDAKETEIPGKDGTMHPIVNMKLALDKAIDPGLYAYFTGKPE